VVLVAFRFSYNVDACLCSRREVVRIWIGAGRSAGGRSSSPVDRLYGSHCQGGDLDESIPDIHAGDDGVTLLPDEPTPVSDPVLVVV
jgi:hypothetical protein